MNFRYSGNIPGKIKKLAAVIAVLSVTLFAGCNVSDSSDSSGGFETSIGESVPSYTSDDSSTHDPTIESSQGGESSGVVESSGVSASTPPDSSVDSSDNSTSSAESSSTTQSTGTVDTSQPTVSTTPPVSSSSKPPVSSSSSLPANPDPPVVTVPDFPVPTSPGTKVATAAKGSIDYSNASQGYISAKYTGSKSKVKLQIICGSQGYPHDVTPGVTEYFPLSFGSGDYTVTLFEQLSGSDYTPVVKCSFSTNTSSLQPFMYSNRYSDYDSNSKCVYKAAELCAGKTKTIDKIAAIFGWVTDNIKYDYNLAATVKSGYVPDPNRTYSSKTGICFDYASLMCAMLRSQGIPTRLVIGWASPDIYHAWNEIYTEETGWISPELMLKKAGWNLTDSTFYASSNNKTQIASYISNSSNYTVRYYY